MGRHRKEIDWARARELYESGMDFRQTATEMDVSPALIALRLSEKFRDFVPRKGGHIGGRRTCSVDGCDAPHRAKGFCMAHYNRLKRTGDATTPARVPKELPPLPPQERAPPSFSAAPEAIKRAADRIGVSL